MQRKHLQHLVCPVDHSELTLTEVSEEEDGRVKTGLLRSAGGREYNIVNFVPRFVPEENYCDNFGFQWKKHAKTQLDRFSKTNTSEDRFFQESKWERDLSGELIVEVGSGAGRFTTHAVSTGATVVSLDFSQAVDANYEHNGHADNLLIVQADLYQMPFRDDYFDRLMCLGVLQHTPDVKKAFESLPRILKPRGRMVCDIYIRDEGFLGTIKQWLKTKYWMRSITKHMEPSRLYARCRGYVGVVWPLVKLVSRVPKVGSKLVRFMCVADNGRTLGLSDTERREWAVLDTFDWFSPRFDSPQKLTTVQKWMAAGPYDQVEVHAGYNGVEARGVKLSEENS